MTDEGERMVTDLWRVNRETGYYKDESERQESEIGIGKTVSRVFILKVRLYEV